MPYAVVKLDDGSAVLKLESLPKAFDLVIDGRRRRIVAPVAVGDEGLGYRFVNWVKVGWDRPGQFYDLTSETDSFDGDVTLTTTRVWTAWDQARIDAFIATRRDEEAAQFDEVEGIMRAAVLVIMDELNRHSTKLDQVLAAAAAASSLNDFKTRMGQIQGIPQRTAADLKTAIRAKLGNGA